MDMYHVTMYRLEIKCNCGKTKDKLFGAESLFMNVINYCKSADGAINSKSLIFSSSICLIKLISYCHVRFPVCVK